MKSLASSLVLFGNTPSSGIITQVNAIKGTNPANEMSERNDFVRKEWLGCDVGSISCSFSEWIPFSKFRIKNKNFDWHTVATPRADAGDAMEAAADVVWAALQANTQVRVEKLCYGRRNIKSPLEKVRFWLLPVRQVHQTLFRVLGRSKSVKMFRVFRVGPNGTDIFSYLPRFNLMGPWGVWVMSFSRFSQVVGRSSEGLKGEQILWLGFQSVTSR